MPSLLHQLDNDSALVLFLAGELPREDHAVVERRLAADPALRAQLDELRSALHSVEDAIAAGDADERVMLSQATAARRVGQAVTSWHARRLAQPRERVYGGRLRLPAWAYGAAACVAAAVLALGIWGIRSDNSPMVFPAKAVPNLALETDVNNSSSATASAPTPAVPEYDPYPAVRDEADTRVLADAEDELYSMSQRSPGDVPSILLLGETDER